MISIGVRAWPMRKFCRERWVCAPQYRSAGTSMGPKLSVSMRVALDRDLVVDRAMNNVRYNGRFFSERAHAGSIAPAVRSFYMNCADFLRADYFLRKRSSRTTSAPSLGLAGSSSFSAAGAVAVTAEGAGTAGRLAAGVSFAASDRSNCRPDCTDGPKKRWME